MRVLILTQETGHFYTDQSGDTVCVGNRSCALMELEHMQYGNTVTQLNIADCEVADGRFMYQDIPFDITKYQAVVKRTWGNENSSKKAREMLIPFLEVHNVYADNNSRAIQITCSKQLMQIAIEKAGQSCPKAFIITAENNNNFIKSAIIELHRVFIKKHLDKKYFPAYVIKTDSGTHGNGVRMFFPDHEQEVLDYINKIRSTAPCVLQEYIKPNFASIPHATESEPRSSHYRIIMSRQADRTFSMIGGINFSRTGSWVSNSHCTVGTLYAQAITGSDLPPGLTDALVNIANTININQFGADVIIDDTGHFFILELNDGMGISGPNLEKQSVPKQYVISHMQRFYALKSDSELQLAKTELRLFTKISDEMRTRKWCEAGNSLELVPYQPKTRSTLNLV